MNEFGIPEKVKRESELTLLDAKLIQGSASPLFKLRLNHKQQQAIQNFTESAHRLSRKRIQLTTTAETWQPPRPVVLPEEQQHARYDLQEGYFQAVYNTLSKLAAVTVVFPEAFPGVPVRSMEKFLKHFAKVPDLAEACAELEKAHVQNTARPSCRDARLELDNRSPRRRPRGGCVPLWKPWTERQNARGHRTAAAVVSNRFGLVRRSALPALC